MTKIAINNVVREMTAEEQAEHDARQKAYIDDGANRKLAEIKNIRLQKLEETDWYSNSDVTMPDNVKTWRQTLRDLPANHTNETAYDALLARDSDGKLTHSIWSKP
tara:strand:+ start:203 stop:520 length:318 start_codon:yes stop_codon:yes gene_type:complete